MKAQKQFEGNIYKSWAHVPTIEKHCHRLFFIAAEQVLVGPMTSLVRYTQQIKSMTRAGDEPKNVRYHLSWDIYQLRHTKNQYKRSHRQIVDISESVNGTYAVSRTWCITNVNGCSKLRI